MLTLVILRPVSRVPAPRRGLPSRVPDTATPELYSYIAYYLLTITLLFSYNYSALAIWESMGINDERARAIAPRRTTIELPAQWHLSARELSHPSACKVAFPPILCCDLCPTAAPREHANCSAIAYCWEYSPLVAAPVEAPR